ARDPPAYLLKLVAGRPPAVPRGVTSTGQFCLDRTLETPGPERWRSRDLPAAPLCHDEDHVPALGSALCPGARRPPLGLPSERRPGLSRPGLGAEVSAGGQ